jgi:hypothetical protein
MLDFECKILKDKFKNLNFFDVFLKKKYLKKMYFNFLMNLN